MFMRIKFRPITILTGGIHGTSHNSSASGSQKEQQLKPIQCILIKLFIMGSFSVMIAAPIPDGQGNQIPSKSKATIELTGTVISKNGKYLLTDATTHRTVELRGKRFAAYVGKSVVVRGEAVPHATLASGATEVILVSKIGISTATGLAGGPATAAATSGLSGVAIGTAAVAAGAAGTVGGLYASGAIGDDQPASRR